MKEIIKALSKAQGSFTKAVYDKKNPHFKSDYASLEAIHEAIREPLAANGLALSHVVKIENGIHVMHTTLFHESGETLSCEFMLVAEKLNPQQFGSLLTYFRRYSICCLLALPTGVEDDDGNLATVRDSRTVQNSVTRDERATVFLSGTTNQITSTTEIISVEEAAELHFMMSEEDPEYVKNIMGYLALQMKLPALESLSGLPRKFYGPVLKSIQKRREERSAK